MCIHMASRVQTGLAMHTCKTHLGVCVHVCVGVLTCAVYTCLCRQGPRTHVLPHVTHTYVSTGPMRLGVDACDRRRVDTRGCVRVSVWGTWRFAYAHCTRADVREYPRARGPKCARTPLHVENTVRVRRTVSARDCIGAWDCFRGYVCGGMSCVLTPHSIAYGSRFVCTWACGRRVHLLCGHARAP